MGKPSALTGLGSLLLAVAYLAPAATALAPSSAAVTQDRMVAVQKRASKLAKVAASVAGVDPRDQTLVIRSISGVGEMPQDADQGRLGWYAPKTHELIIQVELKASVDDGLLAMVETELRRGLGEPAAPWFARGVAFALIGSAGGVKLADIESRTEEVTPREVIDGASRPGTTLAPAEARFARCLMVELGAGVADAWKVVVPGDPELDARLDVAWARSLETSGISPLLEYPRSVRKGTYVVLDGPVMGLAPEALGEELTRIAALGASGVELPVVVRMPKDATPQARSVIEGGVAPLVDAALVARGLGLSVVLAPRFTPHLSADLGPDPAAVEAYGQRRARAVESLSWMAEFAQADGIVLFDGTELCQPTESKLAPGLRTARRSLRRRSLVGSRPFAGDRLAFAETDAGLQGAREEDFSAEFRGALAVINLKVGLQNEVAPIGLRRVGPWSLAGQADSANLRGLSDEALGERFRAGSDR